LKNYRVIGEHIELDFQADAKAGKLIARSYLGVSSRLWLRSDARAVARGVLNQ